MHIFRQRTSSSSIFSITTRQQQQNTTTTPGLLPITFRRHIRQATKYRRPSPGTSERPPKKWNDPLSSSSPGVVGGVGVGDATVTNLEDNMTFIHRPPPTSPSPHSLTTNPISPLLCPKPSSTTTQQGGGGTGTGRNGALLPPLLHPSTPTNKRTTPETILKIQQLRSKNPDAYTRGNLARRFGVSQSFVGAVAALKKPERKRRVLERDLLHVGKRESWSEKHELTMEIRKKRREMW